MPEEQILHEEIEKYRGNWNINTDWGKIKVHLLPKRIGFGSKKGTPDEILILRVYLPILGEWLIIQSPILLEDELKGGTSAALSDLRKFSNRNLREGTKSFIKFPMIVIGKKHDKRQENIQLNCRVDIHERTEL